MRMVRALVLTMASIALLSGGGYAVEMGPIDIHGFVSQGYMQSTANDYLVKSEKGSFEYNEVGVNFSTNLTDKLRLGLQLMARDLGSTGNNEVQVDWAFADYRWRNELGVRLGKIKVPVGLYNETRDVDMLRTWVLQPQSVYPESYRDFIVANEGGSIYGTINAGPAGSIEYQDVLGTLGNFSTESPIVGKQFEKLLSPLAFTGETVTANDIEVSPRKFNTLQVIWNTPLEGLRFGGTLTTGKFDIKVPAMTQSMYATTPTVPPTVILDPDTGLPYTVLVDYPERSVQVKMEKYLTLSGEYKWKDLTLAAEYQETKIGIDYGMDTPALATALGIEIPSGTTQMGYYGSIAYRFTDWMELGAYYSIYYLDKSDKDGENMVANATKAAVLTGTVAAVDYQAWQNDYCVTARFDINPAWCVKLEGHHMNGVGQVWDYADVDDLAKIWSLYAVKTSFSF